MVADGVCEVEIVAAGAQGGMSDYRSGDEGDGNPMPGGAGGVATAVVTVTPGETLQVNVGGQGGEGTAADGGGAGGWNGGGAGGGLAEDPQTESSGSGAGGGGGASDVRRGGTDLEDRVVVGGGGGGVGTFTDVNDAPYGVPGVGGNPATAGTDEPGDEGYVPATGGGAGTDTAGGQGGTGGYYVGDPGGATADGGDGTLGAGGDGSTHARWGYGGGGGGGGLYGGGGGSVGLDWLDTPGGGGSSLGDSTEAGINVGDGAVTITPTGECDDEPTPVEPDETTTTTVAPGPDGTARPATPVAGNPSYTG